jgi:hypothetical protein
VISVTQDPLREQLLVRYDPTRIRPSVLRANLLDPRPSVCCGDAWLRLWPSVARIAHCCARLIG